MRLRAVDRPVRGDGHGAVDRSLGRSARDRRRLCVAA
jgi:hypothetical protein